MPVEGFLAGRLAAYPMPLPFDRGELSALTEWASVNRPERIDEIRALAHRDVRVAVPLRTRTEVMGILLLGPSAATISVRRDRRTVVSELRRPICVDDGERAVDRSCGRAGGAASRLALAAEVQKRLLPSSPPSSNIAEFAAVSLPARSIGGNYYDFIEVGDQRIGIALADLVWQGRGGGAHHVCRAGVATHHRLRWRHLAAASRSPSINEFLYRTTPEQQVHDVLLRPGGRRSSPASLREGRARSAVSGAGSRQCHDFGARRPPLEELTIGGAVVGMLPGMSYEEATVDLCPRRRAAPYTRTASPKRTILTASSSERRG